MIGLFLSLAFIDLGFFFDGSMTTLTNEKVLNAFPEDGWLSAVDSL
jgi:hypothetical protein